MPTKKDQFDLPESPPTKKNAPAKPKRKVAGTKPQVVHVNKPTFETERRVLRSTISGPKVASGTEAPNAQAAKEQVEVESTRKKEQEEKLREARRINIEKRRAKKEDEEAKRIRREEKREEKEARLEARRIERKKQEERRMDERRNLREILGGIHESNKRQIQIDTGEKALEIQRNRARRIEGLMREGLLPERVVPTQYSNRHSSQATAKRNEWTEDETYRLIQLLQIYKGLPIEVRYLRCLTDSLLQNRLPIHIQNQALSFKQTAISFYEESRLPVPGWIEDLGIASFQ